MSIKTAYDNLLRAETLRIRRLNGKTQGRPSNDDVWRAACAINRMPTTILLAKLAYYETRAE